jgi:ferrous iron transport protein B
VSDVVPVKRRVALVGNPNSGKSTLFNVLTGLNQRTGNFPGVTVDKKLGSTTLRKNGTSTEVTYIDLPGTYSIYPKSLDEQVTCKILTDTTNADHPDLVIIVADAVNLKRSLFFTGQIIDLKLPCILVLNMMDEAEKAGTYTDINRLSNRLGIPVIPISARDRTGIAELENCIVSPPGIPAYTFVNLSAIAPRAVELIHQVDATRKDFAALYRAHQLYKSDPVLREQLEAVGFTSVGAQAEESLLRQGMIGQHIAACSGKQGIRPQLTRKLDRILTHKIGGYFIFLALLFIMFQSIFWLAEYPMNWIETGFSALRVWCHQTLPHGILSDLFTDGILAGLSGVLVFIPQIALLFFFIAMLEDSGYMARVSFTMDKLMRRFGLHGRSVIPLISGMACAVPAIMSTRTIGSWKERLITIMITPLMSCSARLPVYILLIALIIPDRTVGGIFHLQALTMMGLYLLGFFMALLAGWIMHRIVKARERSWFIMELPIYRRPNWRTVAYTIYEKVRIFVTDAGKVILTISIVLWLLASFGPGDDFQRVRAELTRLELLQDSIAATASQAELTQLEAEKKTAAALVLRDSYAGHLGKWIEPAIRPLGYDWKIGIALITSLAAREVFVGTMATIYGAGNEEEITPIREIMQREKHPETGLPVYSFAAGISLLLFYAFALQCISTLAVVRRETNSWFWPAVQFVGLGVLAYLVSWLSYAILQ